MLGKRKRRASLAKENNDASKVESERDYHALMRKHFESTYEPLETFEVAGDTEEQDDTEASDEWSGISDTENIDDDDGIPSPPTVEVVDLSSRPDKETDADLRSARKAFMTSKLPSDTALKALRKIAPASQDEDPTSEASLVKNDLALQKLLRESKLLSSASATGTSSNLELSGKSRHKALDTHLQSLGAKTSLHTQKKMPRAQRTGIAKKAAEKEATRRAEAREAGVVLEKVKRGPTVTKRRDRGVGGPGVGKFRGGTLTLSARDVRSIQGPQNRTKGKKGKKR